MVERGADLLRENAAKGLLPQFSGIPAAHNQQRRMVMAALLMAAGATPQGASEFHMTDINSMSEPIQFTHIQTLN